MDKLRSESLCRVIQCRESRSGYLSSSHRLEHRAPLHRQYPLIKTPPMITLKSGEAPVGTPSMRIALSSWWPQSELLRKTAPLDILPSGDPNHPTPNDGMIQNLNSDFNVVRLRTIMESIQCMTPEGSPLITLA
jgi:hypothetical protein